MRVVLRADVSGVGRKGDLAEVADGYARNYLLPKGLALIATPGVQAQAEAMRRARMLRSAAEREEATTLAQLLAATPLVVRAKAGKEGKLFGSVTAADIADALEASHGAHIDRRQVELAEPIKAVGTHAVDLQLHPEVTATVTVEVSAQ